MRKLYLSICCAVFTLTVCGAEKIVFAGDLLTYSGDYRAIAQVYMALRKPEQKLYLLNAGIMGETAADALRRVDCLMSEKTSVIPETGRWLIRLRSSHTKVQWSK